MAHKSHYVITPENGQAIQTPLKQWIRNNLNKLPNGFYEDEDTSHRLRRKLKSLGWKLNETNSSVFAIHPDLNGKFDYAEDFIFEVQEDEDPDVNDLVETEEITFTLEKDLQEALRKNIRTLEEGLKIIDGGKERITAAGRIDITAQDQCNRIVIIELKATEAKPDVIAQILSYMESVKTEDKKEVRGIIVASGFTERVKLATKQVGHLKLMEYSFQFNFKAIQ